MKRKYYVMSRNLNVVLLGDDAEDAALSAISMFPNAALAQHTLVNEHGFDDMSRVENDVHFSTESLLSQLGLA
jgi:hypothetical protein